MASSPLVLEIRGNSLDDGPGIRTVVFFKGCPLSCLWCHNPESRRREAELAFDSKPCIGCGQCASACASGAIRPGSPGEIDRTACALCFECLAACPSGALRRVGRSMEIEAIAELVMRDLPFFRSSGGGVTFSGGEPALFPVFAGALARELREGGVHVLLETCGQFDEGAFEKHLLPHLDLIFFDLKLFHDGLHRRFCGAGNERILRNFFALQARWLQGGVKVVPRVPLIPGITATEENLCAIAGLLREAGAREVALLPYNPLWPMKLGSIGGTDPRLDHPELQDLKDLDRWMSASELEECRQLFEGFELG